MSSKVKLIFWFLELYTMYLHWVGIKKYLMLMSYTCWKIELNLPVNYLVE